MDKKYGVTITVYSTPEYPPISFRVLIPEMLARTLLATPVKAVGLAVESTPNIVEDKTPLLDFK